MSNRLPPAWAKHLKGQSRSSKAVSPTIGARQPQPAKVNQTDTLLLKQALEFQKAKRLREAEELCLRVLARTPENALALYVLGTLGQDYEPDLAIKYFKRAVVQEQNNPYYQFGLGEALLKVAEYSGAIEHLRRACELKPDLVEALFALGQAYYKFGKADMALKPFERVIQIRRDHPEVRMEMAIALSSLGRMDEAASCLREAIDNRLEAPSAYYALANTQKFSTEPPELSRILDELADASLSDTDAHELHMAAGKLLSDLKRFDQAMDHYLKAKTFAPSNFDIATYRKKVDTLINIFDAGWLAARVGFGNPTEVPVFVLGMPRSGTTLTEQICSSHPDVHGAGELTKLHLMNTRRGLRDEIDAGFQNFVRSITKEQSQALAEEYLSYLRNYSSESARVVDKMPHNFEYIGVIALLFPNARIIHCKRDAMDNCLSCFVSNIGNGHVYSSNLNDLGLYYREYHRLMAHWKALLPDRIFDNSYEDMISDQEGQSRRLIDHLGLSWDRACLRFYENEATVKTVSRWQVRQPIYATSVKRWKNYGSRLQPLIDALGDLAEV